MRTAILIPCYNEEIAVSGVINGFRETVPDAEIYVYDNNSTDRTAEIARENGAIVQNAPLQGKGNVMRQMFSDIDADIYIMVDGDGTYDPSSAPEMIRLLTDEKLDVVVGARQEPKEDHAYRRGHRFGNRLLTYTVASLFNRSLIDMLSGYRVMSRRFVKTFPAIAGGFAIETELTIHTLHLKLPFAEHPTPYAARPEGSESKLNTWRDGFKILATILLLFKEIQPFRFFTAIAIILSLISSFLAYPLILTFLETGLVPRFPTAILATGIMILAYTSFICGVFLDTVSRGRLEAKRLAYLAIKGP